MISALHTKRLVAFLLLAVVAVTGCDDSAESSTDAAVSKKAAAANAADVERERISKEESRVYRGAELQEIFVTEYARTTKSQGFAGPVIVDPQTGQLARRALVCTNAACGAARGGDRPRLFAYRYRGARVGAGGQVEYPEGEMTEFPRVCPDCGRADHLEPYLPDELNQRRLQLEQELAAARAAWSAAREQGRGAPTDHRSPTEIAREISDLPGVYLVEN